MVSSIFLISEGAVTLNVASSFNVPNTVALIVTEPSFLNVISPFSSTVAISVSRLSKAGVAYALSGPIVHSS